ncbi:MAG: hypothetical protein UY84_C0001G0238 [Candidatus Adlerbacteria bacterium GW2011_GWA2_54_12]|uniref:UDP-N-acetylmuramate-L-alanine ligase n=4 Tax=Candidatus Adleribacteriota TaxID=1752736 RepID=A0A0G1YZQ0_9BACT|nr:MAG: hypothetical protein UY61_C0031G0005 [Candidatus Adlerbacteria bacterium GW2011_GWC1_50_9]KKW35770.1 MAG: hypothetical protein UY83_C0003G0054 [Candidatus Adlerbacteria bacterium GW2011_GWA1_54_10]KKW36347.1 MAG: hypothetical protein UY84_C0001G0238 [Candidatus Adlerbacteria bacterium GW2011_GWA2_54_12]KKW37511.1 MAG: hypothetical protein UY86_C0007G0020 [Candidatus Adlerbacteria bacterium GW2011_GWB1_54_7]OGC87328.1 MAG: hypothetical protein A3B33_00045 [Candidatus Adlerbacteria bacter
MHWKKAHFIGIGGVGMSAVAKLLKDIDTEVTGSDEEIYPPILDFLKQQGFSYKTPYAAINIPRDADLIVIGKNAKLVPESNEEVAAAFASGKTILSFPEVLGELSKKKETIVVAGSYGKSTCAALLAHCLESAGLEPSYFIGAVPIPPNVSAKIGAGNIFVLEGDEYPSSNTDPRAKFLHYHPSHALITPLAHDHFNVFPTPADYLRPFYDLAQLTKSLVACTEGPLSKEFIYSISNPVTYGLHEGDFHAADIVWGEKSYFNVLQNNAVVTNVETSLLGEHNVQNIVGVAALLFSKNIMSPEQFASAVASFKGIKRRLDRKSEKTSIPIFEGFGSSLEKLRSAIAAMRLHFPARRLIVVFEPHTFSWRNRDALPWYDIAFAGADRVYIFDPPRGGKETQLSLKEMTARVQESGITATGVAAANEALAAVEKELRSNDAILLSSSGELGGLIESIPRLAEQKFPK